MNSFTSFDDFLGRCLPNYYRKLMMTGDPRKAGEWAAGEIFRQITSAVGQP